MWALVALLFPVVHESAFALSPADRTALGVPQQDNATLHGGGVYQHPLGGMYYLRSAIPQFPIPTWKVLPQAPPGVRDAMIGQGLVQPIGYVAGKGHFAKIQGTQAGWVKVEVWQNGGLADQAYYALYDIAILEDQKGGTGAPYYGGYDPRYGHLPLSPDFLEEGGWSYFQGLSEPQAESMFGFDDRYEGAATAWTGQPSLLSPPVRVARWMPQSQLLPRQALQTDSIMTNGRDCQHLRLWIHGPSDVSVTVPIHIHCYSIGVGEVEPGRPGPYPDPNRYDISYVPWGGGVGGFQPPDLYIQGQPPGGLGSWPWPGGVSHDPSPQEDLVVKRLDFRDPPPLPGAARSQRNWVLTVPLKAKHGPGGAPLLSGGYADIEIEARIPTQANVAKVYGDPNWPDEGAMQFRWGTVIGLKEIEVRPQEPPTATNLKQYWYRRVRYELKNASVCDPNQCTLAFAAKAVAGTTGRENDPARLEVRVSGELPPPNDPPEPMRPYAEPYFQEISVSAVNQRLAPPLPNDPFPWAHWTEARWPEDARGPWLDSSGNTTKPESVCLKYRGYVGVIQRTPAAVDFDDEIREYEDKPAQGAPPDADTPITRTVPVHFINAVGDVNNDGLWDIDDEDETSEEGDNVPGMLVNCDINGNTFSLGADDTNTRKVRLLLSSPVEGADYADYKVVIRSGGAWGAQLNFWKDARRQARWEYDPSLEGWPVTLDANGSDVDIYLGCVLGGPPTKLQFFLLHHLSTGEDVPVALDEVKVTFTKFGLDVDSDNNGSTDDDDNVIEEVKPGLVALLSEPAKTSGYGLHVTKHPNFTDVRIARKATLLKEGTGAIRVLTDGGAEFLGAGDTSKDFDAATITGTGLLSYKILPQTKGDVTLKLRLTSDGRTLALDWLRLTVVAVDARIRNGLEGWSGGQTLTEADEESVGAVTVPNLNDTNGNGTIDRDDAAAVTGEKDLMRFTMVKPDPATDVFSEVRVRIMAGDIRAYNNSEKQTRIDPLTLGLNDFNEAASTEKTWWLEARAASGSLRDVDVRYEGRIVNSSTWVQLDRVRATAIWAQHSGTTNAGALSPDDLDRAVLTSLIDDQAAADGSRYGMGPCTEVAGSDTRTGGRIAFQFTVTPSLAHTLTVAGSWSVTFDVTRQIRRRNWRMADGTETWTPLSENIDTFHADDENPNDDGNPDDEDNEPTNAHIFSFDAPTSPLAAEGAFQVRRNHFREWVRLRIGTAAFTNTNGTEEGGRCSDKHDWRFLNYRVRGVGDSWVHDSNATSSSHAVRAGTGNGTLVVTLLADADTEGYQATFASATGQWTLVGTDGGSISAAQESGIWTLTNGTRVTVVITSGGTAFADGDAFRFSVFKTTRGGGKQNVIEDGDTDPTAGP